MRLHLSASRCVASRYQRAYRFYDAPGSVKGDNVICLIITRTLGRDIVLIFSQQPAAEKKKTQQVETRSRTFRHI